MKRAISAIIVTLMLTAIWAAAVQAQQPQITNAKMQARSGAAGLEKEFRTIVAGQSEAAWIGYAVATQRDNQMCCRDAGWEGENSCCGRCRLEKSEGGTTIEESGKRGGTVQLEGSRRMTVLFRAAQRSVEKIRTFSEDCQIDAGGLPVFWLTDVKAAESVTLLTSFVGQTGTADEEEKPARKRANAAMAAIALHADSAADRALEGFTAAGKPEWVREQAVFWLGAAREKRGYEVLSKIVREDPSDRMREKAVFALYVSKEPQAVDAILRAAREDASSHVRGQALFWLAQKASKRAAEAITAAIENDPDTDVKKRAVFALSQLPKDEGVPKLIEVARGNKNAAVRKQAMFWLGQSKDPRAVAFFEEVLLRAK